MSAETAIPEGLAAVAQSVVTVLASVQSAAGADVAPPAPRSAGYGRIYKSRSSR